MKKKVAILLPWLKMGGTNKIALNFMKELSEYCEVTLILSDNSGELLEEIPQDIHLIIDSMKEFKTMFVQDFKDFHVSHILKNAIYYGKIRIGKDSIDNYRYIVHRSGQITEEEFDCAISYHGQSPERLLNLLYRIKAKKKIAWIHGEMGFSKDKCRRLRKYYQKLDHFFFVSEPTKQAFINVIPIEEKKTTVYYNRINKREIFEKAEMECIPKFSSQSINILTVGRISPEKGQEMIPAITKNLLQRGHNVRWYIIGDGEDREKLETAIKKEHVEENVIVLGTRNNPYCYMKNCDIYVQPSYTEGYSTTICEAGMLGKPLIGTKPSGGIYDQITDGVDGLIVEATVEALTYGVMRLIENTELRHQFEKRILEKDFEGDGEINKFLKFLEE